MDTKAIGRAMQIAICGEQSLDLLVYELDSANSKVTSKVFDVKIIDDINFEKIQKTRFRIRNLKSGVPIKLSVTIEGEEVMKLQNSIKILERNSETSDFLTSFNHSTRQLLKNGKKLSFKLESNEEIAWDRVAFEIFINQY